MQLEKTLGSKCAGNYFSRDFLSPGYLRRHFSVIEELVEFKAVGCRLLVVVVESAWPGRSTGWAGWRWQAKCGFVRCTCCLSRRTGSLT